MQKFARAAQFLLVIFALWIGPWAGTLSAQAAQAEPVYRPGMVVVGLVETGGPRVMSLPGAAAFMDTSAELQALNVVRVEVPPGEEEAYREKLLRDPQVAFAELDYRVQADLIPNDPRWEEQYGPENVGAPQAWDITTGSSGVTVAVLDSGLDTGHPDLAGRIVAGRDFVQDDNTPQDTCGHGTHVAGILGANGNNQRGVAGMDWHAKIMPVRVLGGKCDGWVSDVVAGIVWATDRGARIINLSIGASADSTLFQNGTYYAYQKGVALFAAAGNAGISTLYYPARYPWVMAVGAVTSSNGHAAFSNRSNNPADMMVSAPGVEVLSTTPRGSFYYESVFGTTRTYGRLSGTSMAAPHVAGAAALLASQPQFDTPDKIYQALYATVIDLGPAGYDENFGYGLIQAHQALAFTDFSPVDPIPSVEEMYDWVSSSDCEYLEYQWVDATTAVDDNPDDDYTPILPIWGSNGWAQITLPFPFNFAGEDYTQMAVSANGFLSFDIPAGIYSEAENFLIPGFRPPNNLIAPLWDDLNPSAGGRVYYLREDDRVVVEWWQIPHQGYSQLDSLLTFEVILYRDTNEIVFQYQTLQGPYARGSSATVGLEYGDGYGGTQYSYNRSSLSEGQAILFAPRGGADPRNVRGCLFVTTSQYTSCDQLEPFGVEIFPGSLPPPPPATELSLRRIDEVPRYPAAYISMGEYMDITLEPNPAQPLEPAAMVCYRYTARDVLRAGGRARNLFLAAYSGGRWQKLPTAVDAANGQLLAPTRHFSRFGVFTSLPEELPVTGADYTALIGFGMVGLAGLGWLLGWYRRRK